MKYIFLLIISAFFTASACNADTGKTEDRSSLFLRHLEKPRIVKSGTPQLIKLLNDESDDARAFKAAYSSMSRPEMDAFADSHQGHFRVHYDISGSDAPDQADNDLNGIPDYVDSTLVYLEYAWQLIVVDLGFGPPNYDGMQGGLRDVVDCYLKNLASQNLYGITYPDNYTGGLITAYIEIDNDFTESIYPTKGYDALKITTAHEFFHTIHYTYYGSSDSIWWMEQSAVWLEDLAWDDVNDYLNYMYFFLSERDLPLDTSNGSFEYGATLFAQYIAQRYGESIIRETWSSLRDNQSGKIENFNSVLPQGLPQAISDLAVWLYFTGERANNTDFFADAGLIKNTYFPDAVTSAESKTDSLSFHHYTFKYIDISPADGLSSGDSLSFRFIDRDGGIWKSQVILYSSPYNYKIEQLTGNSSSFLISRPFDRAILVIANASQGNGNKEYNYIYSINIVTSEGVGDEAAPEPFVLHQNYPNPFNNTSTIPFTISEKSHITLKIMNMQGATVATLVDDVLYPGVYNEIFDGSGLSSGMYFYRMNIGTLEKTGKMTLMK
ncbi:MAG: T9SS type A sorting domain-containing protein [Candidatus Latescibacteria bacterium]|jgi:hypothetical protein|nr:T9SS type A sorting domain-containing protein [Candidatus Latescibacterota bacterium]